MRGSSAVFAFSQSKQSPTDFPRELELELPEAGVASDFLLAKISMHGNACPGPTLVFMAAEEALWKDELRHVWSQCADHEFRKN